MPRWILPPAAPETVVAALARDLDCPTELAGLLYHKGLHDPAEAQHFMAPKLKSLSDPFLLPDMRVAVDRIFAAVDAGRRIVLYGDYDVDGMTSVTLLHQVLAAFGAAPACFVPHRIEEGYGLTPDGVARCCELHEPELLIALDCGTSAVGEIGALCARGVEVIVVDHHECGAELPPCAALVNPKREGDWPNKTLCTVGLVFKLCHALLKERRAAIDLKEHLDLVALGTVADLVPLVGENRILVHRGLVEIAQSRKPGLLALMEVAGIDRALKPSDLGFQLGPRLNAAGRLGDADDALALLMTDDVQQARQLASRLDLHNRDRQRVEKETNDAAERLVGDPTDQAAIVVGARGWHPGVLGIVASRLCRKFHRPAIVVGFDENGEGKGSGRSIEGLSLIEALAGCSDLLDRFGGHEMAAGVTVQESCFEAFVERFQAQARRLLSEEALRPTVRLDGEVLLRAIDEVFMDAHNRLQPFGMGNSQPLFMARGVRPVTEPRVLKEKHLRFTAAQGNAQQEAIFFNAPVNDLPRLPWDIAFRVERNEWRGRETLQLQVQAIRTSQ